MSTRTDVEKLLSDPITIKYLKINDLDTVYTRIGGIYGYDDIYEELGNILVDAGIDILKYIKSLSRYKMFHVPFSQLIDLSQYTNIKEISDFGFTDCTFSGGIILPPSIITIGNEAFAHASIREGYSLKISTASLKEVDLHAFAIDIGVIHIDDKWFQGDELEEIEKYLNSKGITTYK